MQIELLIPLSGIIALIFAVFLSLKVMKEKPGNELMIEISNMIEQGAMGEEPYYQLVFCGGGNLFRISGLNRNENCH